MTATDFFFHAQQLLEANANPAYAPAMEAYMRHKFPFFGINSPLRKSLVQQLLKKHGLPPATEWMELAGLCFQPGNPRELQYLLGDILIPKKKQLGEDWLPMLTSLIQTLSWWDTVDWLAPHLAASVLFRHPHLMEATTHEWITSDNIWLQRSAIIFQLHAKEQTRSDLLFAYILHQSHSREFFVQKGAGWALRQYSKTNPQAVRAFIHAHELPALTVKEGSKYI
ncbi:MAG: DNA alkylation repair protein [Saprospiraceae bacterium]